MRERSSSNWLGLLVALLGLAAPLTMSSACTRGADTDESARAEGHGKSGADDDRSFIEKITAPKTREIVVPEGTKIAIRLTTPVSSQSSRVGDAVTGVIGEDVVIGETTAIPAGSTVRGTVTIAHPLPKIGGRANLAFAFERLETPDGRSYPVSAMFARTGPSETAKDTATIVAGAIVGAVAGHQVDDDQGRAVGGLAGAGIGTAIAAATDGKAVELPENSVIRLTLRAAVPVQVKA